MKWTVKSEHLKEMVRFQECYMASKQELSKVLSMNYLFEQK